MESLIKDLRNLLTQDPTFKCYALNFQTDKIIGTRVELSSAYLSDFMNQTIPYLCDKVYANMKLGAIPVSTPKEYIEYISSSDDKVSLQIKNLYDLQTNLEGNEKRLKYYNAYMIVATLKKNTFIFITKKNIYMSYAKKHMFILHEKQYKPIEDDLVRLIMHFDCFILNEKCYFTTLTGKVMFGLEKKAAAISNGVKEELLDNTIIPEESKDILEAYIKKPGHSSCLANTDHSILQELGSITRANKKRIEKKYRLPVIEDKSGSLHIDVSTDKKLKDFIDTVTKKRALDFNDNVVSCSAPFTQST